MTTYMDNPADVAAVDLLVGTLRAMNVIDPDNKHGGDGRYASDREGRPYWHVRQATVQAATHIFHGNRRRAEQLVDEMCDTGEEAAYTVAELRKMWASDNRVEDTLHTLMRHADTIEEAGFVQRLAERAGFLWKCPAEECGHRTLDGFDVCDGCGEARPRS